MCDNSNNFRETGRHRASEVILPKFKGEDGRKIYETTYFAGYGRTLSDEETREAVSILVYNDKMLCLATYT